MQNEQKPQGSRAKASPGAALHARQQTRNFDAEFQFDGTPAASASNFDAAYAPNAGYAANAGSTANVGYTADVASFSPVAGCGAGMYMQPIVIKQAAPKRHGWIVALVAIVLLFAAFCSMLLWSSSLVCPSGVAALDEARFDTVAVVYLSGEISYDYSECSPEGLKTILDAAQANEHIKAIVLRVDSGGGTATAGEEMAGYVKACSLPIVVSSASMNASAAYEISSQADYIFTAKSTAIGSIGTAFSVTDASGLYEKLGIKVTDIVSAESKSASYGNRPLTDEERAYYQAMVDQINESFIQAVAEGRNMDVEAVRALATGLPFTGLDAVDNKLADEIGTLEDAIAKAASLANIATYETCTVSFPEVELYDPLSLVLGNNNSVALKEKIISKESANL